VVNENEKEIYYVN